ncbi:MAG: hypothetical protein RLZZ519_94 [Bacteroidota bacterium]|jgi:hypothetical protein
MLKIDFQKQDRHLYSSSAKEPSWVEVPAMNFLMIDGEGDPNTSQAYREAVEALFSMAYALKFKVKKGPQEIDFGVLPLEGLWWADDPRAFVEGKKDQWKWTLMIRQPDFIPGEMVAETRTEILKKKQLSALNFMRFGNFTEGKCAQILHVGPFSAEGPTIERLHAFIQAAGYKLAGKHHEIYLSDIRKAAPEKWRTVIRQAVR